MLDTNPFKLYTELLGAGLALRLWMEWIHAHLSSASGLHCKHSTGHPVGTGMGISTSVNPDTDIAADVNS